MKVPFLDLKVQYETIKDEIGTALEQVLEKTAFAGGPFVAQFEEEFAQYCQCQHAVGVGSGTSALWIALLGLGIGKEDEVITVPNTFIATVEAISYCGAKPVFVDIDEKTYTMNPDHLESVITPRTKAIIPVHIYGQMADMDPILEIAKKYNLFVIEDAAQAQGAEYKKKKAGSIGNVGCFSFYPGKNLGAYGEAGAIITNNQELAGRMRVLRDHGQSNKYKHDYIGWNARMDGFQGAVLSVKLKYLDRWNEARRKHAELYNTLLNSYNGFITPLEASYANHIYHVYALMVNNRDEILKNLKNCDVHCGIHYPVPVHLTGAYQFLGFKEGNFPISEKCANNELSLPMFPEISELQIQQVAAMIKKSVH